MILIVKELLDVQNIRTDFPILRRKRYGKPFIYFDNAATSLKPVQVIDAIVEYYEKHCANIHRGVHVLSQEASELYERAHDKVARFIGARGRDELVFVKNTTEAINFVAHGLDWKTGDEIITTVMEHHSNIVPWQLIRDRFGVEMKVLDIRPDHTIDLERLEQLISGRTRLIAIAHVSNVLGTINPVKEICGIARDNDALCLVDAAQSVPHMPIDVRDLRVDFLAFSSHKMLGPTGVGALYVREGLGEELSPALGGGGMIQKVTLERSTWNKMPWKFEAGTPNISGGIGFGAAVDYLEQIGMKNIREHEKELTSYALDKLKDIPNLTVYGPEDVRRRAGIVTFSVRGIDAHDVAMYLDETENIAVRSGFHCAEPLHNRLGLEGSVRASFYVYDTKEEIDVFSETLEKMARELA